MTQALRPIFSRLELLDETIAGVIRRRLQAPQEPVSWVRKQSEYQSSFAVEEIHARTQDRHLCFIFKDLQAQGATAAKSKPFFIQNPAREIRVYRTILEAHHWGTAEWYADVIDEPAGVFWLFLEKVNGTPLSQIGTLDHWCEAARWLARIHARCSLESIREGASNLLRQDTAFYAGWMERALEFSRLENRSAIHMLAACHEEVVEEIAFRSSDFLHGDFYASNILVADVPDGLRICPVDWEMASIGNGLTDLAALTAGKWSAVGRDAIAMAYLNEWNSVADRRRERADFWRELKCCRFQLCIQWLGWARTWAPPAHHAHDWLGEAIELARELER